MSQQSNHPPPSEQSRTQDTEQQVSLEPERTAELTRQTLQTLLGQGVIDARQKPNLFRHASSHHQSINTMLEPLDFRLSLDSVRGLAILVAERNKGNDASGHDQNDDTDWRHPLVRKQRLTLQHSLLIAILRQHYIAHEQEHGIETKPAIVDLDEIQPSLDIYLGDSGSASRDRERLRQLLENLRSHQLVSAIDADERVTIRPLITHLASPTTLTTLLAHYQTLAETSDAPNQSNPGSSNQ